MPRTGWVSAFACACAALAVSAQTAWAGSGRPMIGDSSVCAIPLPGQARCLSDQKTVNGSVVAANSPSRIGGFGASDLQSAYPVGSSGGAGQTVAIVDATDDPRAESDLAIYRSYYNLPPCTTANGCFKKVDQTGGTSFAAPDSGWAMEISLDLDMVSALCPNCHILLVEAFSSSLNQLGYAENEAVNLGAVAISNSWGACENQLSQGMETGLDASFNHPGVAITVSSGDGGYGSCGYYGGGLASPEYPSVSQYVTAVGGTSLSHSGGSWSESVWNGTESGCSQWEPKPAWQTDAGCPRRTVADVAALADPSTGVAVSDSFSTGTQWEVLGGTSAASPLVAAAYALGWAGGPSLSAHGAQPTYSPTAALKDIASGSNGSCGTYFCQAGVGYDGPTGMGTPTGNNTCMIGCSTPLTALGAPAPPQSVPCNYFQANPGSVPVGQAAPPVHPDGTLIKLGENIYWIQAGSLCSIGSMEVLQSYHIPPQQILPGTQWDASLPNGNSVYFRNGTLIKGSGPNVYVIHQTGAASWEKRLIASADFFSGLGYTQSDVINVPDSALGAPDGPVIGSATQHPDGTVVQNPFTGSLYLINNGAKDYIGSMGVYASQDFAPSQTKSANWGDIDLPDGPNVDYRDGALIRGSSSSVYVIHQTAGGAVKRLISTVATFNGLGYSPQNIIAVADADIPVNDGPAI